MKKIINTALTITILALPVVSNAASWLYPVPVPIPVARYCVTPQGIWPMAVALPVGSYCEAVTNWGIYYGEAR